MAKPTPREQAVAYMALRRATLTPEDFHYSVIIATTEVVLQFFNCALAEKRGPFYLIWTEHHGSFIEHRDNVAKFWTCNHGTRNERTIIQRDHELTAD
jgi:hypothetical protein